MRMISTALCRTHLVLEVAVAAWLLAADGTMLHQTALQPWQWEQGAAGRSGHIQRNTSICMKNRSVLACEALSLIYLLLASAAAPDTGTLCVFVKLDAVCRQWPLLPCMEVPGDGAAVILFLQGSKPREDATSIGAPCAAGRLQARDSGFWPLSESPECLRLKALSIGVTEMLLFSLS